MNVQFYWWYPHKKLYVHGYVFTFVLNIFLQKSDDGGP